MSFPWFEASRHFRSMTARGHDGAHRGLKCRQSSALAVVGPSANPTVIASAAAHSAASPRALDARRHPVEVRRRALEHALLGLVLGLPPGDIRLGRTHRGSQAAKEGRPARAHRCEQTGGRDVGGEFFGTRYMLPGPQLRRVTARLELLRRSPRVPGGVRKSVQPRDVAARGVPHDAEHPREVHELALVPLAPRFLVVERAHHDRFGQPVHDAVPPAGRVDEAPGVLLLERNELLLLPRPPGSFAPVPRTVDVDDEQHHPPPVAGRQMPQSLEGQPVRRPRHAVRSDMRIGRVPPGEDFTRLQVLDDGCMSGPRPALYP